MSSNKKPAQTGGVSSASLEAEGGKSERITHADDPILQAFQAVNDSFIIYDENDRVITFSPQHVTYYPWLEGHLKEGASLKDLLHVVAFSGALPNIKGEEAAWMEARLNGRKSEQYVEDMELKDGRIVRVRETALPGGGRAAALTDITAVRKKELAYQEREAEYRNLLEVSPDSICITKKGRLIYANRKMIKMFHGTRSEDLVGKHGISIIHPDDIDLVARYRTENADNLLEARPLEIRLQRLDGTSFYGDLTTGTVTWQGEKANLCTIRDISFRKNIIEKLGERERDLKAAHKLATIGYWTFDTETRELTSSEELYEITGIDPRKGELTFDHLQSMFPEGEFEKLRMALLAGLKSKKPFDFEHQIYVNGQIRYARGRGHATYDDTGWATKIFGVSQDITGHKKMEHAILESEQRFRDLSTASTDLYWETNEKLTYTFISDIVEEIVGHPKEHYIGRNIHDVFGEDAKTDKVLEDILNKVDRREAFRNVQFSRWNSVTRKTVWIRCSALPYYNKNGEFSGYRGSNTDITKEVELEEQLKQSQKMEAIGQLTGGIAHDFNNLLAVIRGNSELLQESPDLTDHKIHARKLDAITRAADKGADLTQRMLAYSRKQTLNPSVVNLAGRINDMTGILERTLGEQYEIKLSHAPDLCPTYIDGNQIDNTLLNLVLNARDAMPNGGEIAIRTDIFEQKEEQVVNGSLFPVGLYVSLSISDTGAGIPKENLKFVFDPFFTTKEIGKGTGLGLSVVYGFVQQSKGVATIQSEPGQGTCVTLYFPAYQ